MKTANELDLVWAARSSRYRLRKSNGRFVPLADQEVDSIKAWRRQEAMMLPEKERMKALVILAQWRPPQG